MFVKNAQDQTLIKIVDVNELFDPLRDEVQGHQQSGQEEQPTRAFQKSALQFPSGEALPRCWVDPDYQLN